MAKYNGWTNRATWNVALWCDNDYNLYQTKMAFIRELAGKPGGKRNISGMRVRNVCERMFGDVTPDNCKLKSTNWAEIARSWRDEA